jgi:hypothetical protein
MALPDQFKTKVVGVTFVSGYPQNVFRLNDIAAERFLTSPVGEFGDDVTPEPIPAVLIRNPDNEFDANAIEVHVPALGDEGMLGHLPRTVAERLAPLIDSGEKWHPTITLVAVNVDHPQNPGVQLTLDRINEGEPF